MEADRKTQTVKWTVNEQEAILNCKNFLDKEEIYPYVMMIDKGDLVKFTLLEYN